MVGGVILSEVLFRKYFEEGAYAEKAIWKPLIISILVAIPFVLAAVCAGESSSVAEPFACA